MSGPFSTVSVNSVPTSKIIFRGDEQMSNVKAPIMVTGAKNAQGQFTFDINVCGQRVWIFVEAFAYATKDGIRIANQQADIIAAGIRAAGMNTKVVYYHGG